MINSPAITLGPQIKLLGLDLRVQLGQSSQESLQDFPGRLGCSIRGVYQVSFVYMYTMCPQQTEIPIAEALITGNRPWTPFTSGPSISPVSLFIEPTSVSLYEKPIQIVS